MLSDVQLIAPYKPLPWQIAPWRDKSKVILLSGSAGGGKSRLAAEKIHAFCLKYPGATGLMTRKTRESMTTSTVLFMERMVIGNDPRVRHFPSKNRFEYANGSILAYGGMADEKQREQVRSIGIEGGLDFVWMEEATHFTEADFEELAPRMRGRAAGWSQIILSTNPGGPMHWIYRRLIVGQAARVYYSGALDNPYNPPEYVDWLRMLTGVMYLRLVEGKWVQAEGAVYPDFDPTHNVSEAADHVNSLPLYWGCDDGYAEGKGPGDPGYHPAVVLLGQFMPNGALHIFDEYYKCRVPRHEDIIEDVLEKPYPEPEIACVDSSASRFRAALSLKGITNIGSTHPVSEGIKNLRRFVRDGQDVRLLQIHPRCENLIREMQTYSYEPNSKVASVGEPKPRKVDDHGPDALRYMAWLQRAE